MRAAVRLQMVALVAAVSGACAAVEGLSNYNQCTSDCTEGVDATTDIGQPGADGPGGQDGPMFQDGPSVTPEDSPSDSPGPTGDADDSPSDSASDSEMDARLDASQDGLDVVVPPDSPLPDGTIPNCANPPDDNAGVFVSPGGSDVVEGGVCGLSRSSPCKTIGAGLSSASTAAGRSIVYVSSGTYTEMVTLVNGVTVQGGWQVGGDSGIDWTYACDAPETLVTIQAPPSASTTVALSSGSATLTTVTVLSKASASPGQSLYGITASGSTTLLTLNDVVVSVAAAGDGATGTGGGSGGAPPASCSSGDGASAPTPGSAGSGGKAGTFGAPGFVPGAGGSGGMGSAGDNGNPGGNGSVIAYGGCSPTLPQCTATMLNCVGGVGKSGCGGGGGSGGAGGGGGGSSIGLYVWGAQVTLNGGSFTAGSGGKGGPGGMQGPGTPGSGGAVGSSTQCTIQVCGSPIPAICQGAPAPPFSVTASGGAAGGTGGTGSNGGPGGGGAGGDSFAVVTAGAGSIALNGSPGLAFGNAGTGSGPGASGVHGAQGHF